MNIAELIEQLEQVAARLPLGRESEVRVHVCNGDAPGVLTSSVEVDTMSTMKRDTAEVVESFAIVQGHPHRDPGGGVSRPLTMELDDVVQQWEAEFAGRGQGPPAPGLEFVADADTGTRYVLLPQAGGSRVRFELSEGGGVRYLPGSPDAAAAGCICDPIRNNSGAGRLHDDENSFVVRVGCPVHQTIAPDR